ncbi:protein kinase [Streptomyces sp. NPDC050658]|uniref:protein kinase n=1 Tax=unclassified Streptomyces TaxID=2593676 RepID=UPI003416C2D1
MDEYAGRVLADRYRLPLPPADEYELAETRAFDTYSGQEVLVRQVPLPEVVDAEVLELDERNFPDGELPEGFVSAGAVRRPSARTTRRPSDPAVRRAIEAAQAAAQIPDHPRLDQVFDVFAEGGSLWIVSELVAARPLAALLAERPLSPYRAAEIASDVVTALRVLHAHGWVHRNITARTVLVCDDGRVVLTGLAAGAAEEALCGYDPRPEEILGGFEAAPEPDAPSYEREPEPEPAPEPALEPEVDARAARAGAIAAYRAGTTRAAARLSEGDAANGQGAAEPEPEVAGRILDPYGVAGTKPWHGAVPRGGGAGASGGRTAVPNQGGPKPPAHREPAPDRTPETTPARGTEAATGHSYWDSLVAERSGARRGPATALAAERARHARMTVVGAVTERWAPEQAGPVHENWQLAAPIGPATDLWALGALLFRAVQGHAPYPEESTFELVQLVCAEPPAFAEECGPLRPVVESLLRQDPTERLDFEELNGWLRSLVRSAPEPEAGANVVPAPPFDARRLPVIRRRGDLVRRRRSAARAAAAAARQNGNGRHKNRHKAKAKAKAAKRSHETTMASPSAAAPPRRTAPPRQSAAPRRRPAPARNTAPRRPRSLGRLLLLLILAGLVAAVAYAMVFMPKSGEKDGDGGRAGSAGDVGSSQAPGPGSSASAGPSKSAEPSDKPEKSPGSEQPQTSGPSVPQGFTLRKDAEGFRVAVASGWDRQSKNGRGQVLYADGDFELIVVPGRDGTDEYGSDPLKYQREHERELQPFRDSTWAESGGMRRIEVGGQVMGEGQFTWQGPDGGEIFVRNRAIIVGGKYHVVQVRGPEAERDKVDRLYEQATKTYQVVD